MPICPYKIRRVKTDLEKINFYFRSTYLNQHYDIVVKSINADTRALELKYKIPKYSLFVQVQLYSIFDRCIKNLYDIYFTYA